LGVAGDSKEFAMSRKPRLTVAVACLLVLGAAVPSPREVTRLGPDLFEALEGTVWEGHDLDAHTVFHFERGGLLKYSYNGTTYRNGTWTQKESVIYLEMNQKFREFEGRMKDDVITGKSWNVRGTRWALTMKRQRAKK
jgi:hypothetical protein